MIIPFNFNYVLRYTMNHFSEYGVFHAPQGRGSDEVPVDGPEPIGRVTPGSQLYDETF